MTASRKVVHLVSVYCPWEAMLRTATLAAALRDKGWASAITAPEHSRLAEVAEAAGVEVIPYALAGSINPMSWLELSKQLKSVSADLVHTHDPEAAKQLNRSRWLSSVKGVVTSRYELDSSIQSAEYAGVVSAVVCPSEKVKQAFAGLSGAVEKLKVVLDGANMAVVKLAVEDRLESRRQYRDAYCIDKEKPLVLVNMAPLEASSHQSRILEVFNDAVAALPQCHLFIMGEGSLKDELERQIRIMALENHVTLLEPDKAYVRLIAAADLFVSASDNDVSGFMVQCAMAAGRAVAAVNAGCYSELVDDGKNGVLVDPGQEGALRDAVLELLENRTRREHLGRIAQSYAAKHFDILAKAQEVADIYEQIVTA